ncbi:F-box and leucine-rich repeat protein 13 isoform X2 [Ascaphus truei]|uniref:F-box and leucine-rich repeat protein 13 isoform X2 n=1 Tax=Ascaphus truei TaxID=8439 RepID=UPI003F59A214
MASLRNADVHLRTYIIRHSLPEIYEALLCGLTVMCPENPLQFLEQKIKEMLEKGHNTLVWDAFIDEAKKPKVKAMTGSYLEYLFGSEDDQSVSPELFRKAYLFYINNLQRLCFDSWTKYCIVRKDTRLKMQNKMKLAESHYVCTILKVIVHRWNTWVKCRKKQHSLAATRIQNVFNGAFMKKILKAWHAETEDSKKKKEYFERLERGDMEDDQSVQSSESGEGGDEVSQLPSKAVLKIFGYVDLIDLARCAEVCRSWKMITQSNNLLSNIDFSAVRHRAQDKNIVNILRKCRFYVVRINLRSCSSLQWPTYKGISECKNLQELNVSECQGLNDESMRIICEGCPALLYLNLSHTDITNATLRMMSRCLLNLQYLSLAYCRKFTDKGLQYLPSGKGCNKLIYLDLSGCTQITVDGFKCIAAGCSTLQQLKINDMFTLTDNCILALLENCQHITSVCLVGSPHLSDAGFKVLVQGRKLTKIKVEGNNRITDASIKMISKFCPNLNHFYVADCQKITDIGIKAVSTLKNIIVLNVADCIRISDPGVRHIVEGPSGTKIRELNLTNCVRISDLSLLRIAQKCHNLTYLSLRFCENVTDSGIEVIGNMASLISIDLSGTRITDQGLLALGTHSTMKELIVSECLGISDIGIQKFCQHSKGLEQLDISHGLQVTNHTVKTLAFCCKMLTSLSIAGCPRITDLSIQYLSGVCHYLHILDVSGCVHLSDRSLKYLRKGCKQLQVLRMMYCKSVTKAAVLKTESRIKKLEYNTADPPPWFGYDRHGNVLDGISRPEYIEEETADETAKIFSNGSAESL